MSRMAELDMLSYDIEQLWIEGVSPTMIAFQLDCDIAIVMAWMAMNNLEEGSYDPFETVNS